MTLRRYSNIQVLLIATKCKMKKFFTINVLGLFLTIKLFYKKLDGYYWILKLNEFIRNWNQIIFIKILISWKLFECFTWIPSTSNNNFSRSSKRHMKIKCFRKREREREREGGREREREREEGIKREKVKYWITTYFNVWLWVEPRPKILYQLICNGLLFYW